MGLTQNHALGREMKFFVINEVTAGTFVKPTGAEAAKVLKATFGWQPDRKPRNTTRATRGRFERVTGKISVPWSVEAEIVPSGTAGTPPDLHLLYEAGLASYTNTPSTSDVYAPSSSQVRPTVSMVRHLPDEMMESIWGAMVETFTLSVPGGGSPPTVKWDGLAMGHAHTGTSTLNGAMAATDQMVVQSADSRNFETNSVVSVGANDDLQITADTSRPTFTLSSSISADNASAVKPYTPTETTAGTPLMGISGSAAIDSNSVSILGFEMVVKQNLKPNDDEALIQYVTDAIPGFLDITGKITLKARKDWIIYHANRKAVSTSKDLQVIIGSTAGARCKVDLDQVEYDFSDVDIPTDDSPVVIDIPFYAMESAIDTGNDQCAVTFY